MAGKLFLNHYFTHVAPHVEAFTEVTLDSHALEDFKRFDTVIADVAEVTDSYKISGAYDYLLKFVCTDVKSYNRVSERLITSDIGIAKINTLIILERTKDFSGFPLDLLIDIWPRRGTVILGGAKHYRSFCNCRAFCNTWSSMIVMIICEVGIWSISSRRYEL